MAVDSSKLLDRDIGISKGAHISAPQVKMLKVVNVKLKDVSGNLKDNLVLSKTRAALKKRRLEDERRRAREAALEKEKENKGKGGGLAIPGQNMLSAFMNGFLQILWGMVVVKMLNWVKNPNVKKFFSWVGKAGKFILDAGGWLLNGLVNLIDWGYKLVNGAENWIKNNVSEEAAEKFKTFMGNLKNLINGFIAWKLVGEKIFKAIVSNVTRIFNSLRWVIKKAFNIARGALKQGARFLNWASRGRLSTLAGKGKDLVKGLGRSVGAKFGRTIGLGGRKLLKGGSSIMKRGLGGVVKRGALKLFGKGFVKAAGKIFGRIPIIGPIIVGIVSLMSGEPPGQALFKTFGAAIGGMLGTFIPVPVLGTLLGEAIGVFVGDLLYHLIIKRDPKAAMKVFGDTMKGIFNAGKAVVNWIFGGGLFNLLKQGGSMLMRFGKWMVFTALPWVIDKLGSASKFLTDWLGRGLQNFTDSFPTFDVPDVGLQDAYIAIADKIGLGGVIDWEIPNWVGIPDGLKGLSIRKILDSLPRIPDILGLITQFIPGLSAYTEGGKLKKLPAIWQLANPVYMVPALIKSFFQGGGKSAPSKPPAQVSGGGKSDASDVSESASYDSTEGTKVIVPISIPRKDNVMNPDGSITVSTVTGSSSSGGTDPASELLYMGK